MEGTVLGTQPVTHTFMGQGAGPGTVLLPAKILLKVIASHAVQVTVPLVLVRICFSHRHQ